MSALSRPLAGAPREVERQVTGWLVDGHPEPLVVRTSGSTGEAKQVALSGSALRWSAVSTLARLGGPGGWVLALPAHHVAGLQVIVRSFLAGLSPVVLSEHKDLATATGALSTDLRYLAVVPTQLHRWMAEPTQREALRRYDAVLVGGAAADPELVRAARGREVAVTTTYGMTETSGGCVYDGWPLDGVRVDVGEDGRIRVAGPMLFDGYIGDPERTAEVMEEHWFRTSDLGSFDANGRLEVLGRADDVVMSGGVSVSLTAVERSITEMASVAQCVVVAQPDAEWGSRLVAHVVAAAGTRPPDLAEVRDFVSATHPRSWAPKRLVVAEHLPLLESGKIDRLALASFGPPAPGSSRPSP